VEPRLSCLSQIGAPTEAGGATCCPVVSAHPRFALTELARQERCTPLTKTPLTFRISQLAGEQGAGAYPAWSPTETVYRIPGAKRWAPSQPSPKHDDHHARLDAELLFLGAYRARGHVVFFGSAAGELTELATLPGASVVIVPLEPACVAIAMLCCQLLGSRSTGATLSCCCVCLHACLGGYSGVRVRIQAKKTSPNQALWWHIDVTSGGLLRRCRMAANGPVHCGASLPALARHVSVYQQQRLQQWPLGTVTRRLQRQPQPAVSPLSSPAAVHKEGTSMAVT
jgi:hypothetical protein